MQEIEANIGTTEARRKELVDRVPKQICRLYERIHKRLGRAVVEVLEGHCSGCNLDVPPQMYNEIQRGDKIHQCPYCFRILFFKAKPEAEEPGEPSA